MDHHSSGPTNVETTYFGHEADVLVAKYLLHCFWYAKESGWAGYQRGAVIASRGHGAEPVTTTARR
jgi:hypothetical protein